VGYHNGAAIQLSDIADVEDFGANIRTSGYVNGKPCVNLIISRQPGANIIGTVEAIQQALPSLKGLHTCRIDLTTVIDRTTTIRAFGA